MRRPAVFFDRDNTLIIGNEYLGDPSQVVLVAGAASVVAKCREIGYAVVVVSNQSGVARGLFSEEDVRAVDKKMAELLQSANRGAVIDRHEFCPFHPDGKVPEYRQDSFLRKPKPGMILAAAEAMALDLGASWMVGDAPRDIIAGQAAGCRTILIVDPTLPPSPAASEHSNTRADFVVGSLIEAAEVITRQANKTDRRLLPDVPAMKIASALTPVQPKPISPPPAPLPPAAPKAVEIAAPGPMLTATGEPLIDRSMDRDVGDRNVGDGNAGDGDVGDRGTRDDSRRNTPESTPKNPVRPDGIATRPAPPRERPPMRSADAPERRENPRPESLGRVDFSRLEAVGQQLLLEVKKLNEHRQEDFSLSKLIAGIVQILALAALPLGYVLYHSDVPTLQLWLLTAIFLQALTVALLIMGRQR